MQNHREAILFICGIVLILAILAQLFFTEPVYAEPAYPVVDVDMEDMSEGVIAFSDDGKGVQSEDMMRQAMIRAKALGKMLQRDLKHDRALLKNAGERYSWEYESNMFMEMVDKVRKGC